MSESGRDVDRHRRVWKGAPCLRALLDCIIFVPRPMSTHEFSVPARDLDASGRHYRFSIRASWMRGTFEGTDVQAAGSDGELDVRLSKSGKDIVVRGTVSAELSVACARCLEPARFLVNEPLVALAVPGDAAAAQNAADGGNRDADAEQADILTYDGETVVLDNLVRDELLLGIPMIPLCSEGCPGIRPVPAQESDSGAIDPRLRPLLRLKKNST